MAGQQQASPELQRFVMQMQVRSPCGAGRGEERSASLRDAENAAMPATAGSPRPHRVPDGVKWKICSGGTGTSPHACPHPSAPDPRPRRHLRVVERGEAHPTPEPTAPPPPQDRAKSNEAIASLTEKCWEKCMGYPGKSLSSREEQCFMNCARRFVDTTQFLKRELEDQAGGGR